MLTKSPWIGKIASLFLFYLFLWTYQNNGGEWRVAHIPSPYTFHVPRSFCANQMANGAWPSQKKKLSFTDSLTQMPPSWGIKLSSSAFTDTGAQVFSEDKFNCSRPEMSEGDVCICPDHGGWGTTESLV